MFLEQNDEQFKNFRPYTYLETTTLSKDPPTIDTTVQEYYYLEDYGDLDSTCSGTPDRFNARRLYRTCTPTPDNRGFYRIDEVTDQHILPKLCTTCQMEIFPTESGANYTHDYVLNGMKCTPFYDPLKREGKLYSYLKTSIKRADGTFVTGGGGRTQAGSGIVVALDGGNWMMVCGLIGAVVAIVSM
ncbi:hypothetical protein HDV00_009550 [Rhizophlyctis rosea]|nr:hypothetical protein HDV00_009550 [Rhizophlyctis rosea]